MSTHVNVRILRHMPPYMPGEVTTLPVAKADELKKQGLVDFEGKADAPVIATGAASFDPNKSPIEEVKAFVVGRGGTVSPGAPEAPVRKSAAAILAKDATA